MVTISRWGYSVYERAADIQSEKTALNTLGQIIEDLADAEILITHSKQKISYKELDNAPSAKLVITTTSGTDHIDKKALKQNGVRLARMPMIRRDAVVETTIALLLDALRLIWRFQADARREQWSRGKLPEYMPKRISDITIGVVGHGVIGSRLVSMLEAFGAKLCVVDPKGIPEHVEKRGFSDMGKTCDAILFACDLNPTSKNIVNQAWLDSCREGIILVNAARGQLIDIHSAKKALESGKIGCLALDVFPNEPFEYLHWVNEHPNLICLPHSAGFHPRLAELIKDGLVEIVSCYISGRDIPFEVQL